jgi:hypothetical protein
MAGRQGHKIKKAARRAAYATVRAVLPQGVRRRVRAAMGPSKAEQRRVTEKAERFALKQRQTQEKHERTRRRAAEKTNAPKAKMKSRDTSDSQSNVGPH